MSSHCRQCHYTHDVWCNELVWRTRYWIGDLFNEQWQLTGRTTCNDYEVKVITIWQCVVPWIWREYADFLFKILPWLLILFIFSDRDSRSALEFAYAPTFLPCDLTLDPWPSGPKTTSHATKFDDHSWRPVSIFVLAPTSLSTQILLQYIIASKSVHIL